MKSFEYGDTVETTMEGSATFEEYSNGGTTYRVKFTDGPNAGAVLSLGEKAILSHGRQSTTTGSRASKDLYESLSNSGMPTFEIHEEFIGVEFDIHRNPEAYETIKAYATEHEARVEAHAPAGKEEKAIREIMEATGFERAEASRCVRLGHDKKENKTGKEAHDVKYNLFLPNSPSLNGLDVLLQTNFDHRRSFGFPNISKFQINKKSLILQLVRDGAATFKNQEEN
jgi:hypothetical protein